MTPAWGGVGTARIGTISVVLVRLFGLFLCLLGLFALCFPLPFLVQLLLELSNFERVVQDSFPRLFFLLLDCKKRIVTDFGQVVTIGACNIRDRVLDKSGADPL